MRIFDGTSIEFRYIHDRVGAISILKGLSILGVLIIHAKFDRFGVETLEVVERLECLFQWCVPAFFFLSGYLTKLPINVLELKDYACGKMHRLLVPYMAFTMLYKLTFAGLQLKGGLDFVQPAFQLYFLLYLLIVSVVIATLAVISRGSTIMLLIAMAISFVLASASNRLSHSHGPDWPLTGLYAANYLAGILDRRGQTLIASVILGCGTITVSWLVGNLNLAAAGLPPLLLGALKMLDELAVFKPFGWLGNLSAQIYVWHAPLIMPAASKVSVSLVGSSTNALVLTLVIAVAASVACDAVVERSRWLRPFRI